MDTNLFGEFLKTDKAKLSNFVMQLGQIQGSVLVVSESGFFQQTILEQILNLKNGCLIQVCDVANFSKQLAAKFDNIICFDANFLKDVDNKVLSICDLCGFGKDAYMKNVVEFNLFCLFYYIQNEEKFVQILENIDNLKLNYEFKRDQSNIVIADDCLSCVFEFLKYNFVESNGFPVIIKSKNVVESANALTIPDNSNVLFITGQNSDLDKTVLYSLESCHIEFNVFELPVADVVLMNFVGICVFEKKID